MIGNSRRRPELGDLTVSSEGISLFEDEEVNPYAENLDGKRRMDPRSRKIFIICVILAAVFAVALVVPKSMFVDHFLGGIWQRYNLAYWVSDLMANVGDLAATVTGQGDPQQYLVYVVVMLAGAGLALSGAVYQGAFRNALVTPSTLGVMTGAHGGLVVWVLVAYDSIGASWVNGRLDWGTAELPGQLWSLYSLSLFGFVGALVVVGIVLLTAKLSGRLGKSAIMLIITGQVIASLVGVFSQLVTYYLTVTDPYGLKTQLIREMQVASFYRAFTWIDIAMILVPLAITFGVVMHLRQKMMALTFGEAEARSMGIDVTRMQVVVVGLCTLLTAIVVSFCGTVGFVGFLVPHLARRLVGPNFQYLLPASAALGALFVLSAYTLLNVFFSPDLAQMTGMFISIGGAAVFLVTALRQRGSMRHADWK